MDDLQTTPPPDPRMARAAGQDAATPSIRSMLDLPANAAEELRAAFALEKNAPLRISYLPGPGSLYATYEYWKRGEFDPRVPSVAYSTMFYELCAALSAQGQIVSLDGDKPGLVRDGPFRFDALGLEVKSGGLSYHQGRLQYALACLRVFKDFAPHATVVASDLNGHFLPVIKRCGARLVYSIHNTRWAMGAKPQTAIQKIADATSPFWLRVVDSMVCTSHECERQIYALTKRRIPSFVATPQQIAPPAPAELRKGPPSRLFYLGRIEDDKGVFDLLDAFETLYADRPSLRLVYAGGGSQLPRLQDDIARRGLGDVVRAAGHLSAGPAHEELKKAHLLICPTRTSFREGLAYVCFEAAANGTPSIMSSVVPAQDLLRGGCVVFEADKTAALTRAIAAVLDNPDEWARLSQTTRARAEVMFDRSRSWGSQLYRALLAAAG